MLTDVSMMGAVLIAATLFVAGILLWRVLSVLESSSGRAFRAAKDERRFWRDQQERLLEKLANPTPRTAELHANERARETLAAARTEIMADATEPVEADSADSADSLQEMYS